MAAPKKYPDELRARAVRLWRASDPKPVIRRLAENPARTRSDVLAAAAELGCGPTHAYALVRRYLAGSRLTTYVVSSTNGDEINRLNDELTGKPGVDMVAPFGTSLHVSGRDAKKLAAAG